jgi:hypothetical protein
MFNISKITEEQTPLKCGVQKLNLQHGFQLGEQSLPQSKHNAGSSGTEPQSGHCILTYLVDKKASH